MPFSQERIELCVTYVAQGVRLGVNPDSIEFIDQPEIDNRVATAEGHVELRPELSFYVIKDEFGIGRSVVNDLYMDSPKISRSHAKIVACRDGSYELHDAGSTNGTWLIGEQLDRYEKRKLGDSGEIQLAGVFHIRFMDFAATAVAPDTTTIYGLALSHRDRRIWMQGASPEDTLKLSNSEYRFLKTLMGKYPEPASHREFIVEIWGWEPDNASDEKKARDALFNVVKRLRERLESLDPDHGYIETVRKWGDGEGGYKFNKQ
jgi:DNA-binding winged helix-turn-helix (wHTH) protein